MAGSTTLPERFPSTAHSPQEHGDGRRPHRRDLDTPSDELDSKLLADFFEAKKFPTASSYQVGQGHRQQCWRDRRRPHASWTNPPRLASPRHSMAARSTRLQTPMSSASRPARPSSWMHSAFPTLLEEFHRRRVELTIESEFIAEENKTMTEPSRYNTVAKTLHWLIAIAIIALLVMGKVMIDSLPRAIRGEVRPVPAAQVSGAHDPVSHGPAVALALSVSRTGTSAHDEGRAAWPRRQPMSCSMFSCLPSPCQDGR